MKGEKSFAKPQVTLLSSYASPHCLKSSFLVQNSTLISRENLFWVKTRENAEVLDFLAVDNFDFTRKNVKNLGENS